MKRTLLRALRFARRLHRDERGAEGLEKLLIIAAVVLPLLGVLIFWGDDLIAWVRSNWESVKQDSQQLQP